MKRGSKPKPDGLSDYCRIYRSFSAVNFWEKNILTIKMFAAHNLAEVVSSTDSKTDGIPDFSLYGETQKTRPNMFLTPLPLLTPLVSPFCARVHISHDPLCKPFNSNEKYRTVNRL